ncbi:MAG: hypothetical protein PHT14_06785 [Petrimonas sp.]|nr:hypothetical protein [Petrimonas sp.]MDD4724113.1 hypothetical protein [Fermentimonas sp.]
MKNQTKNITAPITATPLKCDTVTDASEIIAPVKTAALFLVLFTALLFLLGCKAKHTIIEKTTTKTDSTANWNLNDSLYKTETLIAILKSDLQRLSDENLRLMNETSMHQISYDTSAPVNPQTGKPPITSEVITISKSTLEQTKKEYETLLQTVNIENESLTRQNRVLHLTVEKLTNKNKQFTEKLTTSPALNFKLFFAGLLIGVGISFFVYIILR